ncbi:hypothetical protein [Sphaerisporangium sp. TRM90804]|uniref:hypothetical protein n=1 Tax=Sphaerisporangium sp. TRM90804 TaxID=3031113 RepID=UPI00244684AF|nr:hypothetical protein [Sphaerisporangium sp. TRM90804]MDH2424411.1 hypothetical protein [Sphaerisporangium sp. TRM90804]
MNQTPGTPKRVPRTGAPGGDVPGGDVPGGDVPGAGPRNTGAASGAPSGPGGSGASGGASRGTRSRETASPATAAGRAAKADPRAAEAASGPAPKSAAEPAPVAEQGPQTEAGHGGNAAETGGLAERIADAVTACPGVASLKGGVVATHLPGRTVAGVSVGEGQVRVAVVARYGPPLAEIAGQIRASVTPLAPGMPIHVHIQDVRLPREGGRPSDA